MTLSPAASGVVVFEGRLEPGVGALQGESHGSLYFGRNLRRDLIRLCCGQRAVLDQHPAETRYRIAAQCCLVLLAFAEDSNGFVFRVVQRDAWGRDDVPMG